MPQPPLAWDETLGKVTEIPCCVVYGKRKKRVRKLSMLSLKVSWTVRCKIILCWLLFRLTQTGWGISSFELVIVIKLLFRLRPCESFKTAMQASHILNFWNLCAEEEWEWVGLGGLSLGRTGHPNSSPAAIYLCLWPSQVAFVKTCQFSPLGPFS